MRAFGPQHVPTPWPRVAALAPAERLLVEGFRRWSLGWKSKDPRHWSMVWNDFARACGSREGRSALSSFARLVDLLRLTARRTVRHHAPCCPYLAPDEIGILALVAACQHRQDGPARAAGAWLIASDETAALIGTAARLAEALRAAALVFPPRPAGLPMMTPSRPPPGTLLH